MKTKPVTSLKNVDSDGEIKKNDPMSSLSFVSTTPLMFGIKINLIYIDSDASQLYNYLEVTFVMAISY